MERKHMERFNRGLSATLNFIDKVEFIVVASAFLSIITINSIEIFRRFVLNKSFFWVYEITILLANIMYFLGASLVYKRKQDIQMEYFIKFFSISTQKKWDFVVDGACFYFFVVILYQGIRLLSMQTKYVSQGLGIPNHYFSLPLVLGTLSMILIIVQQFLSRCLNQGETK